MSKIEKMSIQGIRSFGPDDQEKQVISFFTPLTLILGPNGTGKTTIIECLKYMTTGVMPPGCSKGGAFIHDPKVAHETEVKGQVRLQFRDITGQQCVVQRIIQATQKAKKIETKTLDGVVTRRNAAGEKQSITSKCADLDREMISSLGVSRPVLENVIFCHQEDANWPLSEGKQLKEKFDAIFASTRYVKALDTIKKTKKEQDDKLRLYKGETLFLKQHKDKAQQYEGDLSELEAQLASSKERVNKINQDMKPVEDKLNQIDEKSADIFRLQNDITKLSSEKKQIESFTDELQRSIENEFQGSDEELKRILAEFKEKLQEREIKLAEYEDRNKELSKQEEKLDREKSTILVEVGRLEQEAERQEENIQKRDTLIAEYAAEYEFEGFDRGPVTDEKYKNFLRQIQGKLESMMNDTKKLKAEFESKEADIQKKMDELRDTKTKLEQNEKIKKDMMADNKAKIRQINQKLSEVEASAGRLDQIKRELKRNEHELQTKESSLNTDDLKQEISDIAKEKSSLEGKISELSSEMNQLTLQSSAQAQLDVLKKDKASKEENIRRLRAKQEDTIQYLLGHVPSRNIWGELEEYIGKQTNDVRKCSTDMNESKNNLTRIETERKNVMTQLKQKEDELKGLEERVFSVCGSQNFDEGLQTISQKMTQAQDTRGSLLGAEHFFKKYVSDLEKEEPCCPLCHREFDTDQEVRELVLERGAEMGASYVFKQYVTELEKDAPCCPLCYREFDTEQEVRDLISELKDKLRMVPNKLQRAEKDLDEFQKKYDALNQLKPLRENMESLKSRDIPTLQKNLKKNNDEIQKLRDQVTDIEEILQTKENDEAMAKLVQPDIVMMDRYYGEITELDKKINIQASKLAGGDSGRTLQSVIDEKEDLQVKVDGMSRQLDHKRQKLSDHSDQVQALRATINGLREEKLTIENDLQQRIKLEEDKANLETENDGYAEDIKESSERLRPLQSKIDRLREEKDDVILKKDDRIEAAKAEVEVVKSHGVQVKNVNQEIKSYNQSNKAETLEQNRTRKEQIERKIEKIDTEQKDVIENIDKLRKDLSTQKLREEDLRKNSSLRGKFKEVKLLSDKISDLKERLGDMDVAHLERERRKLKKMMEDFDRDRHTAEGRQRGFEDQIRGIMKELQSDMYKGAAEKYRNKMIDVRTTELASADLEKYYRALDKAIMNYHNMKMEEINKIIRELWRNTYKGHDIETIEIRSDEDDSATMKTRKTYNYRVVMIKPGDVVMDMRGRCSAGQKVLASLIIRLALAETFCLNCGILALDEPTTNLDRENIESLAGALVDIIKGRIHQRNFQLVVITHDEDFVELLGRSDYVDEFFKVRKSQDGCSQLYKARVQDMHSR